MNALEHKSIALIIPDFNFGGEEKRVTFFVNNYINHFKHVYLISPSGMSDGLLHEKVSHFKISIRDYSNMYSVLNFIRKNKITFIQGHKRATMPYLILSEIFNNTFSVFNFDNIYLKGNDLYKYITPHNILYLSDVLKNFYDNYYSNYHNRTINMGGDFYEAYSQEKIQITKKDLEIEEEFVFLSLGRLSEQKNHKLLIEALSNFKSLNFKCLIVGCGELDESLKSLTYDLGLDNQVKFLGHREDIEKLLNIADVIVQTSIFEGFPNVIIEAASVGIPIVASDVGSTRTLVGSNGVLFKSNDSKDLIEALHTLINNYSEYKNASTTLRSSPFLAQFHKNVMLENYLEYYRLAKCN